MLKSEAKDDMLQRKRERCDMCEKRSPSATSANWEDSCKAVQVNTCVVNCYKWCNLDTTFYWACNAPGGTVNLATGVPVSQGHTIWHWLYKSGAILFPFPRSYNLALIVQVWCHLVSFPKVIQSGTDCTSLVPSCRCPNESLQSCLWCTSTQLPYISSTRPVSCGIQYPQVDTTSYRGYMSNTLAINLHNIVSLVSHSRCDTRAFLIIILSQNAHNTRIRSQLLNSRYAGKKHNSWSRFDTNMQTWPISNISKNQHFLFHLIQSYYILFLLFWG